MKMSKDIFSSAFVEELHSRGYESCHAVNNPWLPVSAIYTDAFGCQYSVVYDDEQMNIVIMVNHICDGDESEMLQQMIICNNFNAESLYARFYCNDSGGIIVRAEVPCATENLITICSDVFEIVSEEVATLVAYLDAE